MIRPHLPFIVPTDTWALYNESEIKLPVRAATPLLPHLHSIKCIKLHFAKTESGQNGTKEICINHSPFRHSISQQLKYASM
jgi:hypothetical protein